MAEETQIGGTGEVFVGEDKVFQLTVQDTANAVVDITGWTIIFVVKVKDTASDPGLISVTCALTDPTNGVCTATVADTVMDTLLPRTYRYSFKRTDGGAETILAYGDFVVQKATAT